MGAGKEAGEVEYAADAVLVLTREPFLPEPEGNASDSRPRSLKEDRRSLVCPAPIPDVFPRRSGLAT